MPRKRIPPAPSPRIGAEERSPSRFAWKIRHGDDDVYGLGDQAILERRSLGLICSVQCPGSVVIKTFDAIRELRDAGTVVAGGFHSPMEKECLEFLLRGTQPVIICPAKGLARPRIPEIWRTALAAGRLVIVSPLEPSARRTNKANAQIRNEFVAALACAVLIPHAAPGGNAEALARQVLERGQPVFTFEDEANDELLRLGAQRYSIALATESIQTNNVRGILR